VSFKLSTRGICKRYGATAALLPTDLDVQTGELLTLLGPSGSGKTTLLQLIAGLIEPTEGRLLIDDEDATDTPVGSRGIGMVFQSYALFPHMTVGENVAYPLRMRRIERGQIASEVQRALAMVKMEGFESRYPRELSGGQQQRVALARCFVYRPQIVLLDEPLGALDKNLREHMQLELRKLHRQVGATFIYVTHDQEEALTLSDRVCLMNHARIEQLGKPHDIYDRPVSRFAAAFIGHSNLLDGGIGADGSFRWNGRSLPVPDAHKGAVETATLMVRPEMARLAEPGRGFMDGVVSEVVFHGSDVKVLLDVGAEHRFSARIACRAPRPAAGDRLAITWDPDHSVILTR
jgi:putative spermidine/putrescine transport system ATP-binding protein